MAISGFDLFVIVFTIVIIWAFKKHFKEGNLFVKGFIGTSLLVFLFMDIIMVFAWFKIDITLKTFGL